jgi:hypothetical protein
LQLGSAGSRALECQRPTHCRRRRGQQGLKLLHGVPAQPFVDFVPLDRAIGVHSAAQKASNVFHRQRVIAFHRFLEVVPIQRADFVANKILELRPK